MRRNLSCLLVLGSCIGGAAVAEAGLPNIFNFGRKPAPQPTVAPTPTAEPPQAPQVDSEVIPASEPSRPARRSPAVAQPRVVTETIAATETEGAETASDKAQQPLLDRLTKLSDLISANVQAPDAWRHQVEQAEILLQLATLVKGKDRDQWIRMAIDSYHSAAQQGNNNERPAYDQFAQLPQRIMQMFPGHPLYSYAALKVVEADCQAMLEKNPEDAAKAEAYKGKRLLEFAANYPQSPEAPKAIIEAALISEAQGKANEACSRYKTLMQQYPGHVLAKKARGARWRLAPGDETVRLELPELYVTSATGVTYYNLEEARGKVVVVYFWNSDSERASADFQALRQVTDGFLGRGLEVVYVNLDNDPAKARAFLAGRLTAGTHVHQKGNAAGGVVELYGIQNLPQIFLIGRDGKLLKHSLKAEQVGPEVAKTLNRD